MFCFKINTPFFFIFYFICLNVSSQDPDTFTSFQDGIYNDNTASTPWTTTGADLDGIPDSDDDIIIINEITLPSLTCEFGTLDINASGNLVLTDGFQLNMHGNFVNNDGR